MISTFKIYPVISTFKMYILKIPKKYIMTCDKVTTVINA